MSDEDDPTVLELMLPHGLLVTLGRAQGGSVTVRRITGRAIFDDAYPLQMLMKTMLEQLNQEDPEPEDEETE